MFLSWIAAGETLGTLRAADGAASSGPELCGLSYEDGCCGIWVRKLRCHCAWRNADARENIDPSELCRVGELSTAHWIWFQILVDDKKAELVVA